MKQSYFEIISNRKIAVGTWEMVLCGDTSEITCPGQFVDLKLDGFFLRRPISVCYVDGNQLTLIYKAVGKGTDAMTEYTAGRKIDILTGLGNGYDLTLCGNKPLLIGGGAGVPPMMWAAKRLKDAGIDPVAILGFNTEAEIFGVERFRDLGVETVICTADGSVGVKGFVTDGMKTIPGFTYTYACGPMPMLRAVNQATDVSGQFSFEERMGCGFGACVGCTTQTRNGNKRVCKDGPVFCKEEILW